MKKRKINDFLKRLRKAKTAAAQFEKPGVVAGLTLSGESGRVPLRVAQSIKMLSKKKKQGAVLGLGVMGLDLLV